VLMAPLLVVLPFGPFLAWKRGDLVAVTQRLAGAAGAAIFGAILIFALSGASISLAPLGLLLGFWVGFGAIAELIDRAGIGRMALGLSLRRLIGLPRSAFSTALAHFGLAVTVVGIVSATAWESELVTTMQPGATHTLAGYSLTLESVASSNRENFIADTARFAVTAPNGSTRTLTPERRFYPASQTPTTEAAIETYGFSQLYLQLGESNPDGSHVVRAWYKPYVTLIWLGCVLMAGAGMLSLSDRRLRIGAPRPAAAKAAPAE